MNIICRFLSLALEFLSHIEPKLSSVSGESEKKKKLGYSGLDELSLICVHGLALFMSTTFSAFFVHVGWLFVLCTLAIAS